MPLYGKELANTIPATITGNQARSLFGNLTVSLHNAYNTLASYDSTGTARVTGLDAGSVKAARDYLDSTNDMLGKYYPQMPANNSPLPATQLAQLRTAVSTTSVAVKTIDDLFNTSWLSEIAISIVQAVPQVISKVSEGTSSVLWAFFKNTWWIFVGAAVVVGGVVYAASSASRSVERVATAVNPLLPHLRGARRRR